MADEALNMLHNGSGSRMDVFKCISILPGTDGYGLANCSLCMAFTGEGSPHWVTSLNLVTGAEPSIRFAGPVPLSP